MYEGYFIGESISGYVDSKIQVPLELDPYAGAIKWRQRPQLNSNLWGFIGYWTQLINDYAVIDKELQFFDTSGKYTLLNLEVIDANWKSSFRNMTFDKAWNNCIDGMNYWLNYNPSDFQNLNYNELHYLNIVAENCRKFYSAITSTIIYISRQVSDELNESISKAKSVLSFIAKELTKPHSNDDTELLSDLANAWSQVFNNINIGYGYYIAAFDKLMDLVNSFYQKYAEFSGVAKVAIEGLAFKLIDDNKRLRDAKPNIVKYVDSLKQTITELSNPFNQTLQNVGFDLSSILKWGAIGLGFLVIYKIVK